MDYNYITVEGSKTTDEVITHKTLKKARKWAKDFKTKKNRMRIYRFIEELEECEEK